MLVGNSGVGQRALLNTFIHNAYPGEYIPRVFDRYSTNIKYGDRSVILQLDTNVGLEDYKKMRLSTYFDINVVVICFSLVDPYSFSNVENEWFPEVKRCCPDVPYILVGTKCFLRK